MPQPVKAIPLLDLLSFLIETPDSPTHVGMLQIYRPVNGTRARVIKRLLQGFREAEVAPPFNYVPLFPAFALPQWAVADSIDMDYHIRKMRIPSPGTQSQLIDFVMQLHEGVMDRSRPGWIAHVIDGLEDNRLALYLKIHHAYIDGASANMRFEAAAARSADDLRVRPLWSPLFEAPADEPADLSFSGLLNALAGGLKTGRAASGGMLRLLGRNLLQAGGQLQRAAPLPFSAPHSLFNAPVHAARRLGVGSLPLQRFKAIARAQSVSVNDVALTIVGAALERYASVRDEPPDRALVAICPMSIRLPGDTSASTQFAAIAIKLGEPGTAIEERLRQVNASASDAKEDARSVSRAGLVAYMAVLGGSADLLAKSPLAAYVPPTTNVNVSNVAGPDFRCFLAGAELEASYPVSTLAGGTAINITFASLTGRMEYAIVSDALAIPDPQLIATFIADALEQLEAALQPPAKTAPRRSPRKPATRRRRVAG